MTAKKYPAKEHLGMGLAVLAVVFCTACGAKLIRGVAPIVRMTELSHQDNIISLQLSMRNLNGVPLDMQTIHFSLSVNDDKLFTYNGPVDTNIVANGTETWSVEIAESKTSREQLDSLQNGEVKSLPYLLKGSITSKDDGNLRFEHEDHIYPRPGRPGHFR